MFNQRLIHRVFCFFVHFVKSKHRHGVHSPLVFEFMDKGLKKCVSPHSHRIEAYRKENLNSALSWISQDFGTGNSGKKFLKSAARYSSSSTKKGEFLHAWVRHFKPKNIMELGTNLGISAAYLSTDGNHITTVEGDGFLSERASAFFQSFPLNITVVNDSFENFLINDVGQSTWDLVVIDGNHTGEALRRYFEIVKLHLSPDGWVLLDDIHWSKEMTQAWQEIISGNDCLLTLDFYYYGAVKMDGRMEKEHFDLRF